MPVPASTDYTLMAVGVKNFTCPQATWLTNFIAASLGTLPDQNDYILMQIGLHIVPVSRAAFTTNWLGQLPAPAVPCATDRVMMKIGLADVAVTYAEFVAGGWATAGAPLALVGTPDTTATVGVPYAFNPSATGGTAPYVWSIANKPSWASFSTVTGALTGTPSGAEVDVAINITVTDAVSAHVATGPFTITVSAIPATGDILSIEVLAASQLNAAALNFVNPVSWVTKVTIKGMGSDLTGTTDPTKGAFVSSVPGYNTSRAIVNRARIINMIAELRKPWPNQATPYRTVNGADLELYFTQDRSVYNDETTSSVAIAAGLYTATGGGSASKASQSFTTHVNHSDLARLAPQFALINQAWSIEEGATVRLELGGTSHFFQSASQFACVEFNVQDSHAVMPHTYQAFATTMTDSVLRGSDGIPTPTYGVDAALSAASFDDGVCAVSAKIYCWEGTTVWDTETIGNGPTKAQVIAANATDTTASNTSTPTNTTIDYDTCKAIPFIYNNGGVYTKLYAVIDPTNALGHVAANLANNFKTTQVAADLTPYLTPNYAIHDMIVNGGAGKKMLIAQMCAATYDSWRANNVVGNSAVALAADVRTTCPITITHHSSTTAAGVILDRGAASATDGRPPGRYIVDGITIRNPGTANPVITGVDTVAWATESYFRQEAVFKNCVFDSSTTFVLTTVKPLSTCGRVEVRNSTLNYGGIIAPGTKSCVALSVFNTGSNTSRIDGPVHLGCNYGTIAPGMGDTSSLRAINYWQGLNVAVKMLNFGSASAQWVLGVGTTSANFTNGVGVCNVLTVPNTGAGAKGGLISGDGQTYAIPNVCVHNVTIDIDAFNELYNESSFANTVKSVATNWISTTIGSPDVEFTTTTAHGLTATTDYVNIYNQAPSTVGGILIQGLYQVLSVTSSTKFKVTQAINASATAVGGNTSSKIQRVADPANGYVEKWGTFKFIVAGDNNTKSDMYHDSGQAQLEDPARVGCWRQRYWVGFEGYIIHSNQVGTPAGLASELSDAAIQRLNSKSSADVSYQGGGLYKPSVTSDALNRVLAASGDWGDRRAVPFDIYGVAVPSDGTGAAGAVQP